MAKKTAGRPKGSTKSDVRNVRIALRITDEEYTAIEAAAKADNRTVSDYVRLYILKRIQEKK